MENEIFFKQLCEEYKRAVINATASENIKQNMRQKLIKYNDGNFDRFGIEIKTIEILPTIDWDALRKYLNIPDAVLLNFTKEREPQIRITCKKEIILGQ